MMDDIFASADSFTAKKAKIRVIGVGGGGNNAINQMVTSGIEDVDFMAVNTDAQALKMSKAPFIVQVGADGLGAGTDPKIGRQKGEESIAKLRHLVKGVDLLFITACMGGGTGTGVAPVLARVAKEEGGENILVVAVITRPFKNEGIIKSKFADEGIKNIQEHADCCIIIPNDRVGEVVDVRSTDMIEAYKKINEVLLQAVKGITDVITKPGDVNRDYNDVKRIMAGAGRALIGIGVAEGADRHIKAVKHAITSPLIESGDIKGAKGFIVHFMTGGKLSVIEHQQALDIVGQYGAADALIMYGHSVEPALKDKLQITVIATGFAKDGALFVPARKPTFSFDPPQVKRAPAADKFQTTEEDFLIPAYLRRKKES